VANRYELGRDADARVPVITLDRLAHVSSVQLTFDVNKNKYE